jgi:hypothetical protein
MAAPVLNILGTTSYKEKNPSQYHFVDHKTHEWAGSENGFRLKNWIPKYVYLTQIHLLPYKEGGPSPLQTI